MKILQHSKGQACIKFYANGLEVSISVDDSCKMALPTEMFRSELRIYDGEVNITNKCFKSNDVYDSSNLDIIKAIQFIENKGDK